MKHTPDFTKTILERKLTFGRFEGCLWEELCKSYPGYVVWAIDEFDWLTQQDKDLLFEAVDNLYGWDNIVDREDI